MSLLLLMAEILHHLIRFDTVSSFTGSYVTSPHRRIEARSDWIIAVIHTGFN